MADVHELSEESRRKSHERHQLYMKSHPDKRCLKCALKLSQHTVEEFQQCECVLATGGKETLVMNRPMSPCCGVPMYREGSEGLRCSECDIVAFPNLSGR